MYGTLVVSYKQGGNARHSPFTQMRTSEWRAFLIFKKTKETTMSKELAKTYDPKGLEDRLYQKWLDSGYFHAKVNKAKKPFTIVMPPPNVTGQLHMGHALDETMQDILIRFKRMQGYEALWQPGTDHAAIATEVKVINKLKEQGIDKNEIGREEFLKHAWAWKEEYGGKIINQLKKLGASADWERERFTMDEGCSKAVQEVFIRLYNKGYIYKGSRIINWCPVCQTSISDAEVEHEDQDGFFWHINYPVVGEEGKFVEIATTRPETLLGDTAVAVNPEDDRYKDLVGKMLKLPLTDREIPVIADAYVDKEFGTGCVKITPAHDPNDFEVGKRHNLEEINILNDDATINDLGGKYAGMDRYEARKAMVKDLEDLGLLVKVVPHSHSVGTHDRCGTTVEPMIKPQWFVKMDEMAKAAIDTLKDGDLQFVPERFDKTYLHWLENIRDWCISRQLWWGHRIPAYYCDDCGETVVAKEMPKICPKCGKNHFHQDEDTLDTWFSSALWPFSTLGWPDNTEEMEYFYPTDVLVTGYDIIFFWVIRMIFSGYEQMGEAPFHTVLFHGLVRDSQGRKMSKSLGNCIYLSEESEDIKKKVFSMFTDPNHIRVEDPGSLEGNTVFTYLDAFCKPEYFAEFLPEYQNLDELKAHYQRGGLGDMKVKRFLNNVLQAELEPIRNRRKELQKDIPAIYEILKKGSEKAEAVAAQTLKEVKDAMKINYFDDKALIEAQAERFSK